MRGLIRYLSENDNLIDSYRDFKDSVEPFPENKMEELYRLYASEYSANPNRLMTISDYDSQLLSIEERIEKCMDNIRDELNRISKRELWIKGQDNRARVNKIVIDSIFNPNIIASTRPLIEKLQFYYRTKSSTSKMVAFVNLILLFNAARSHRWLIIDFPEKTRYISYNRHFNYSLLEQNDRLITLHVHKDILQEIINYCIKTNGARVPEDLNPEVILDCTPGRNPDENYPQELINSYVYERIKLDDYVWRTEAKFGKIKKAKLAQELLDDVFSDVTSPMLESSMIKRIDLSLENWKNLPN